MKSHIERLKELIGEFLQGDQSFDEFQESFSRLYIDEIPEAELSPEDTERFGAIHERAEMTATQPTEEERRYGWVDVREFREWLRDHMMAAP